MDFLLTGCRHVASVRVYAFEGVASDRTRTAFTVSIDTGLIGKYAIALQDLPLLCRQFLERRAPAPESQALTFTEAEMAGLAAERADALHAVQQRKFNRKNPGFAAGAS